MNKLRTTPEGKAFSEIRENMKNETMKTVWMTDLKKAGERAEYLWFRKQKKGAQGNG